MTGFDSGCGGGDIKSFIACGVTLINTISLACQRLGVDWGLVGGFGGNWVMGVENGWCYLLSYTFYSMRDLTSPRDPTGRRWS